MAVLMIAGITAGCGGGNNGSGKSGENDSNAASAKVNENAQQEDTSADLKEASAENGSDAEADDKTVSRVRPDSSTLVVTESGDDSDDVSVPDDDEHVIDPEKGDDPFKADNPFIDLNYTAYKLNGKNIGSDVKLPAYYLLTSTKELTDFIDKYKKVFSLSDGRVDGDSANTDFISRVQQLDESFFKTQDAIVIVAACENADDADLGSISYGENKDVSIELWGAESSGSNAQYVAYTVTFIKDALKDRSISIGFTGNVLNEEAE